MAKKPANKKNKEIPVFSIGDRVEIIRFAEGIITSLRGHLGPNGELVYRVMYRRKPKPAYIEVLGNQLRPAKIVKRPKSTENEIPPVAGASSK